MRLHLESDGYVHDLKILEFGDMTGICPSKQSTEHFNSLGILRSGWAFYTNELSYEVGKFLEDRGAYIEPNETENGCYFVELPNRDDEKAIIASVHNDGDDNEYLV